MGFADSVKATADKMQSQVNDRAIQMATDLFTSVVQKTPVGMSRTRGQLINNWFVGQGVGAYNRSYTGSFNTSGINSYSQISTLNSSKEFEGKDGEVSFTNSVPYAFRAEYAGWPTPKWTGRVQPYAMIRNSLTAIAAKYSK